MPTWTNASCCSLPRSYWTWMDAMLLSRLPIEREPFLDRWKSSSPVCDQTTSLYVSEEDFDC